MLDVLRRLIEALDAGERVTYCRLVETRGSTPQKAGALMLVFPDGSQAGTLGGGCVEAEVKRRALVPRESAELLDFKLDSDYGWDDGLICGGRMRILVEPLTDPAAVRYYRRLADLVSSGAGAAEVVVYDGEKSGLPAPSSYLFDRDGQLMAVLGDAALKEAIGFGQTLAPPALSVDALPERIRCVHRPLTERPQPSAEHGVAFLPALSRCRLLIVGGGHIGTAVGNMATDLGFDVWVVDDREEYCSPQRFPRAERLIRGPIGASLRDLPVTSDTYCLIVTRGHNHDEEALFHLVDRGARYVGMIGSKRKIRLIYDDLLAEGVSPSALAAVHAPVGIDIGSQTVPEIAVSILAELIAHRNRNGEVPGRPEAIGVQL